MVSIGQATKGGAIVDGDDQSEAYARNMFTTPATEHYVLRNNNVNKLGHDTKASNVVTGDKNSGPFRAPARHLPRAQHNDVAIVTNDWQGWRAHCHAYTTRNTPLHIPRPVLFRNGPTQLGSANTHGVTQATGLRAPALDVPRPVLFRNGPPQRSGANTYGGVDRQHHTDLFRDLLEYVLG